MFILWKAIPRLFHSLKNNLNMHRVTLFFGKKSFLIALDKEGRDEHN